MTRTSDPERTSKMMPRRRGIEPLRVEIAATIKSVIDRMVTTPLLHARGFKS